MLERKQKKLMCINYHNVLSSPLVNAMSDNNNYYYYNKNNLDLR